MNAEPLFHPAARPASGAEPAAPHHPAAGPASLAGPASPAEPVSAEPASREPASGAEHAAPGQPEASTPGLPLTLYVHMPWCVRKCPYCDFNSHQLKTGAPPGEYIDALIADFDAELPALEGRRLESVFFGGGTPSLFRPEDFARLLTALRRRIEFAAEAEVTLEANPGTVERGRFSGYAQAGINRVSLGAQSFSPRALARLGRIHSAQDTHRAVEELHASGIRNFNLDLMYALPGQTLEEALLDVRTACALAPAHISYYQLALEPGTVFHARPPQLPDDDAAFLIQEQCQQLLAHHGFEQYEISAYARPGARCRHNLNYWLFGDYVGIGAGAHGKLTAGLPDRVLRTEKPRQPADYLRAASSSRNASGELMDACGGNTGRYVDGASERDDARDPEGAGRRATRGARKTVAPADLPFEFMLNALRLNDGFALREFQSRTGLGVSSIEPQLRCAQERGLVEVTAAGWRASELGRRFLNDLQAAFLA